MFFIKEIFTLPSKEVNVWSETIFSNAKINLFLKVNRISNGLHDIISIMIPYYNYKDKIKISISKTNFNNKCDIVIKNKNLHLKNNSILKAIKIMRENYKFKNYIFVEITKKIPIGGGLGGASSNAAMIVIAINKLLKMHLSKKELKKIAFKIGSDCPFFIENTPCLVTNLGKTVIPCNIKFPFKVKAVLFKDKVFLSKDVYEKYQYNNENSEKLQKLQYLIRDNKQLIPSLFFNDLQNIILQDVKINKEFMRLKNKYQNVIVAGAGSTLLYFIKTDIADISMIN